MAGTFLLVEDDADQIRLVYGILEEIGAGIEPVICGDGVEAIDSLAMLGKQPASARPALMILDLKLPRQDGFEVLRFARSQEDLKGFPIVILSESTAVSEVSRALANGASAYFVKPFDMAHYADLIRAVLARYVPLACVAPTPDETANVARYYRGPDATWV